jgi:hypothetical protein
MRHERDNCVGFLPCLPATVNLPPGSGYFSQFGKARCLVMVLLVKGTPGFGSPVPIAQFHPSLKSLRFATP